MMNNNSEFLRLVARAFVKNEGSAYIKKSAASGNMQPFGDTTFVFPNRRSMKFFQKYMGEEYGRITGKPLFSPQMLTISELFGQLSGLQTVDPIEALYILYRNYIALKYCNLHDNSKEADIKGNLMDMEQAMEQESFDEFVHWGGTIIADFNDIDKYLIDSSRLFTNIRDLKQLEGDYSFLSDSQRKAVEQFWRNFLNGGESFKKENFSALWGIMYDLYKSFAAELRERGLGYEGMIYRSVAESIMRRGNLQTESSVKCEELLCSDRYGRIVFIGFNAPNRCEKALMQWLKERDKGDFYWDFYGPMVTDHNNKASMFISDAVKEFPSRYELEVEQMQLPQFNLIGVPSGVGQAFVVSDILREIQEDDAFKTAVVLPDETLLMPVLNSIPDKFSRVNVTMGFPISATALKNFMNSIAQLQKDVKERGKKLCLYHASVVEVLNHEYVKGAAGQESEWLVKEIVKQNHLFIEPYDKQENELSGDSCKGLFANLENDLLKALFRIPANSSELLDYLIAILKELDLCVDTLDKEFIYRYYLALDRLKSLGIPMKKETCLRLLSQITSSITIPFRGEPLAGLQVIGSLETRALDFENVIILSVNEGRFPASREQNSLIPYNLRVGFALPTYEVVDAIAAYHFYRSIYRAKRVWLLYDTRSEGIRSGEASRYVKQLKFHYNIDLNERVVGMNSVDLERDSEIKIIKTPQIMQKLKEKYAGRGGKCLSASSLKTYISCPVQFYLQKIEGIKEEETVNEEIENNTFGTLFHYVMESIYSKYIGELVSAEIIEHEIKSEKALYSIIDEGFKELGVRELIGQNLIVREVIKRYVLLTLYNDKKYAPFIYIASEGEFYHTMQVNDSLSVNFIAKIDRIDKRECATGTLGDLRVIDYKTTKKDPSKRRDAQVVQLFDGEYKKRYEEWLDETFQLYLYAYIIANNPRKILLGSGSPVTLKLEERESNLSMVIYPITKSKDGSIISEPIYGEKLREFEAALKVCIEEIFDESVPFSGAKDKKSCEYCMFKSICGR